MLLGAHKIRAHSNYPKQAAAGIAFRQSRTSSEERTRRYFREEATVLPFDWHWG